MQVPYDKKLYERKVEKSTAKEIRKLMMEQRQEELGLAVEEKNTSSSANKKQK
jgi:hypothetical protein